MLTGLERQVLEAAAVGQALEGAGSAPTVGGLPTLVHFSYAIAVTAHRSEWSPTRRLGRASVTAVNPDARASRSAG